MVEASLCSSSACGNVIDAHLTVQKTTLTRIAVESQSVPKSLQLPNSSTGSKRPLYELFYQCGGLKFFQFLGAEISVDNALDLYRSWKLDTEEEQDIVETVDILSLSLINASSSDSSLATTLLESVVYPTVRAVDDALCQPLGQSYASFP
ncbi:hypothetical protein BX616_010333 [Lobosporangium transversale]|uniref:Uncharacterized protein n=1 Tax=Lobosporangium transversale TaxID=64571 RepID=A0A1Y2GWK6_9FUNG|nr:hypothetical protein BCR41DRAFT_393287 [Lobosporangium transversale]KAF9912334.1 hypothetical protein BX616_010333 [Lobosporangium transversale]ORZ26678.1 hypothetical protein BCR41DRAFT_393287 [Lobosporangium transversale]|eukprot:XP_021884441.1 hypothetical protein BCR41DRAFT_393287 [Lobosporangium transversale]